MLGIYNPGRHGNAGIGGGGDGHTPETKNIMLRNALLRELLNSTDFYFRNKNKYIMRCNNT